MKKYWKLVIGSILFPILILLGYFFSLLIATANLIIEFEWEFTEVRKSLNIPSFSELWDNFKKYLKELRG